MIAVSLAEVAAATGGRLAGGAAPQAVVTGPVVADSRQAAPGALFVALSGERTDGHHHAASAVEAGAVAVLAGRELDVPCVVVDDQLAALAALARHVVDALPELTVVGVTGSSGKTSTKDLLAVLLGDLGPTVAPQGSFNNEIGLPLTALRCDTSTRYLVAEMGARMPGNIAYLTRVTPPDVAVVLNVGAAHAGVFGSREETARTKGELPEALAADGVAVLNADDPLVAAMAARTEGRVVRFGFSPEADVRAEDVRLDAWSRPSFLLRSPAGDAPVTLPLHGEHHVANALAAAAVALERGMPPQRVAELLASARPASRWRMEVTTRADGVTVVNDAYNANPDSVRAALKALAAMGRPDDGPRRRTWAVLGEMLELGDTALAEHDAIGRLAVRLDVSRLVAVGEGARAVHAGASHEGSWGEESAWVPDADAALALLRAELRPGDVVLVKASRSIGLDAVATALLQDASAGVPLDTGAGGAA
ncbi:MAG TPA: UDP-N-acetylmuramoyl-tripeptide--D-alanyl-D-alanine ligase [Kineosporiaceae bacterium]|nr:UDP-N-acetylmuramoyl-tripeptide--D-alanyl-D-alanine ligase [Kineosporiaceae bacterium]